MLHLLATPEGRDIMRVPSSFFFCTFGLTAAPSALSQPTPPPQHSFVETVHGVKRSDPYRWMEKGGEPFERWAKEEARWARSLLDDIPGRAALFSEIQKLDRPSPGMAGLQSRGGRWLYDALPAGASARTSVIRRAVGAPEKPLNLLALLPEADGPWSEVRHARVLSPDGRFLAFGTTRRGEDDPAIRVYDVQNERLLPDVIAWPLWADSRGFRPRWLADSSGFFYVRNPRAGAAMDNRERAREGQVFLHRLGTSAADDRAIFGHGLTSAIGASDTLYVEGEPDARWLAILNRKPSGRDIWVVDLRSLGSGRPVARKVYQSDELVPGFGVYDEKLYTLDSANAERYRLVAVDLRDPKSLPVEALPQQQGVLGQLQISADAVYVVETALNENRLHVIGADNRRTVMLPGGSVESVSAGLEGRGVWLELTDWLSPRTGWLVRPGAETAVSLDEDQAARKEANSGTVTELHWATARDGVRIPYTLVRRADARQDRSNYVLMAGYGCYGTVNSPFYWPALTAWLDRGGVFVQAGVRGGGELGSAWHRAGSDQNKPTSFEDAIDTVRHLVSSGWTQPGRIGLSGGSCGGATMGMAALEAPHLIGAAVLSAAALDMRRIAEATAAGARSIREFGDPETPEGARRIDALSPYRQLLPSAKRPAFLIMSGATDYTIPLWIGGKFVAAARASNPHAPPVVWRVDWTSGHNAGRNYASEDTDLMAFMFSQLDHPDFKVPK